MIQNPKINKGKVKNIKKIAQEIVDFSNLQKEIKQKLDKYYLKNAQGYFSSDAFQIWMEGNRYFLTIPSLSVGNPNFISKIVDGSKTIILTELNRNQIKAKKQNLKLEGRAKGYLAGTTYSFEPENQQG